MRHEPLDQLPESRIEQEVIPQRQNAPEKRKQRADNALDIAPEFAVVPEAQMEALKAHKADDVFQQRHRQRHNDKHHGIIPERAGKRAEERVIEFRKNKQQHRAEAVERQAGAEQEAGVQPFALRVRAGEKAPDTKI